ncbi:CRISPR-associated endonuclease Cas2 [uncultured Actinobacillus sp.]|uniref:CRISPR-associated endonuclease Cas2 n=1 Tax=uncultured Actinobacillus sp. TaxID=417616 RepID=UPI00344EEDBB
MPALFEREALDKHHKRLCEHLPEEGSICCVEVTEKQFAGMQMLLDELKAQEKK